MKIIYRKKVLLSIIQNFGGELSSTHFQKLLFLFTQKQLKKSYDFVPYKYGCFSFQSMADKSRLIFDGYLENTQSWKIIPAEIQYASLLNEHDKRELEVLYRNYNTISLNKLIKYIYIKYPYYAIKSEIAEKYLNEAEMICIRNFISPNHEICLFTIGYEGKSLEEYLNHLIKNNINVLCDVRKNPISMKYGFAKTTLRNACETLNIKYIHIPKLGIESTKRMNLKTQQDYDSLFREYEDNILPKLTEEIYAIVDLLKKHRRIALTCFELSPDQCHRTRVSNAVIKLVPNVKNINL